MIIFRIPIFLGFLCSLQSDKITTTLNCSLLSDTSGKESSRQCRRGKRCGFDPWIGMIPCGRKWQPIPVFLPGKSPRQRLQTWWAADHGVTESGTSE